MLKQPCLVLSWLAVLGGLCGCSTWQPVPIEKAEDLIRPGDTVRVTRADGFQKSFKVEERVVGGTIRCGEQPIALVEVSKLEKRSTDPESSEVNAGVVVTIAAAVAAIIWAATGSPFAW